MTLSPSGIEVEVSMIVHRKNYLEIPALIELLQASSLVFRLTCLK